MHEIIRYLKLGTTSVRNAVDHQGQKTNCCTSNCKAQSPQQLDCYDENKKSK